MLEFHKSIYLLFGKYAKPPLSLLKPLVFWGLVFRFFFVLAGELIRRYAVRLKSRTAEALLAALDRDGRIRVLRVIARLNIGGPSIHVHLLAHGLDRNRFRSTLVTGKISPQEGDMSYLFEASEPAPVVIPELQREISLGLDLRAVLRILRILRQERPDILHTHTAKAGTSARLAIFLYKLLWQRHVRVVHTFHGHVFEGYFSRGKTAFFVWIERSLARVTDVIIAISGTQRRELTERYRVCGKDKIRMIELGFDLDPFLKSEALQGRFRRQLGVDPATLLIGMVGRLVPIKNHRMFFRAAELFLRENAGRPVKFVIVGDGELRSSLEEQCRRNGLQGLVHFCGWTRAVPEIYADLDILALTSLSEGTPVSIIEAMASLVPVAATDAGGVLDLLGPTVGRPADNGFLLCERGILCRKNDARGFARALKYLADESPTPQLERAVRARLFARERFSEKRLLADMERLYLQLMKTQPGAYLPAC